MQDKSPNYRIRGICYCVDQKCDAIFDYRVYHDHPNLLEQIELPCGHKIARVIYSAKCFKEGAKAEERLEKLTERLRADCINPDDYLD